MRALIIALVVAALAAGGFFLYRQNAPEREGKLFDQPAAPAPAASNRPEDCLAENAMYEFREDRRLQLRLRRQDAAGAASGPVVDTGSMRMRGDLDFIVRVTTLAVDTSFRQIAPDNAPGPKYETLNNYLRAPQGNGRIQVTMFDSNMRIVTELPRTGSPAPAYIYAPGMMPSLYAHRVDLPGGMFAFQECEEPAPATTTTAAP